MYDCGRNASLIHSRAVKVMIARIAHHVKYQTHTQNSTIYRSLNTLEVSTLLLLQLLVPNYHHLLPRCTKNSKLIPFIPCIISLQVLFLYRLKKLLLKMPFQFLPQGRVNIYHRPPIRNSSVVFNVVTNSVYQTH